MSSSVQHFQEVPVSFRWDDASLYDDYSEAGFDFWPTFKYETVEYVITAWHTWEQRDWVKAINVQLNRESIPVGAVIYYTDISSSSRNIHNRLTLLLQAGKLL